MEQTMARNRSDAYLQMLAQVPLFAPCNKKELKELSQLCEQVDVPAGKIVCKQGSVGYECFVLITGTADVEVDGKVLAHLGEGGYFGELALLDKRPRSATVTATSDCHMLVLGPRQFATALDDIPGMAHRLLSGMATRLREANARMVSM
jgi:CRP-like cAMP-binding protein